jgi:hypothetical protein
MNMMLLWIGEYCTEVTGVSEVVSNVDNLVYFVVSSSSIRLGQPVPQT